MTRATSSLSEQAVREITDMILVQRRFHPGDKLPNELELAEELGISRITLREAIRVLRTKGLLEIQRGRGTFVLPNAPAFTQAPNLSGAEIRDLLEFLLCTEPEAARCAAKRAQEAEIEKLEALCQEMAEQAAREQPVVKQAEAFQRLLGAASHNPVLAQILPAVYYAASAKDSFRDNAALSVPDQREIVRALRARAPEAARAAAQMYLLHLWQENGLESE